VAKVTKCCGQMLSPPPGFSLDNLLVAGSEKHAFFQGDVPFSGFLLSFLRQDLTLVFFFFLADPFFSARFIFPFPFPFTGTMASALFGAPPPRLPSGPGSYCSQSRRYSACVFFNPPVLVRAELSPLLALPLTEGLYFGVSSAFLQRSARDNESLNPHPFFFSFFPWLLLS